MADGVQALQQGALSPTKQHQQPQTSPTSKQQPSQHRPVQREASSLSIVFSASWIRLTAPIGEGAFSRVYEGVYRNPDSGDESVVAIKILKKSMLKRRSDCLRFIKEAKTLVKLQHRCGRRWWWRGNNSTCTTSERAADAMRRCGGLGLLRDDVRPMRHGARARDKQRKARGLSDGCPRPAEHRLQAHCRLLRHRQV